MGYAGSCPTLRIDLNMLRGDKIRTRRDFTEDSIIPQLGVGDVVRTVEEEGDQYLAVVEQVEDKRVWLRLLLESWSPAVRIMTK